MEVEKIGKIASFEIETKEKKRMVKAAFISKKEINSKKSIIMIKHFGNKGFQSLRIFCK